MKRALIIIGILAVLAVAGYFGYQRFQSMRSSAASNYQTITVSRGDLTASVGATGTVRSNQSTVLNWQLSGKVDQVQVKVGDVVQAGQELANLQESSLPQSVILARADLVTAQRNLDQLLNSDVARAKASQAVVAAQKELDDAKQKRESKNYARALPPTVDEARANLIVAQNAVDEATKLYDRMDARPQDDPIRAEAFSQLAKARRNYDRELANLNWLLGRPDSQEVSEADARVTVAEAALKDAQREWDRLKNGPDSQDVAAAKARIAAIQATLDQINLEAPFTGTVTDVNDKPGDQTTPGQAAFRIDDLTRLLVDVQITEVDINRIRTGQPAMMTFDAIPEKEYSGKITEIARVGTPVQGVVNFLVTIELSNADDAVRPGMTAAVNIITDLVENTLLVQNRAVRLRDGKHVVYVLRNGVPQITSIELGLTSDAASQVIGGDVREGDVLVLNPPVQFQPPSGRPGGGGGQSQDTGQ
jgi:HlyD family secretion protein